MHISTGAHQSKSLSNSPAPILRPAPVSWSAFTLIELLTVIAIISILASLVSASSLAVKSRAHTTHCINNLKQLQVCWQLYAQDNGDALPPNLSTRDSNGVWRSSTNSWIGFSSALIDTDDSGIRQGLLFKYDYNRSVSIYHCPSDRSKVKNGSQLRLRSYSMNGTLGGRPEEKQIIVSRQSDIKNADKVFVIIDENEDSIDDAHFLTWAAPDDRWVNMPTDRHQKGAGLSFADGHVERWAWKFEKNFKNKESYWKAVENKNDLMDLRRLQEALPQ